MLVEQGKSLLLEVNTAQTSISIEDSNIYQGFGNIFQQFHKIANFYSVFGELVYSNTNVCGVSATLRVCDTVSAYVDRLFSCHFKLFYWKWYFKVSIPSWSKIITEYRIRRSRLETFNYEIFLIFSSLASLIYHYFPEFRSSSSC